MPHDVSFGNYLCDGFARDFTAADGQGVMAAASHRVAVRLLGQDDQARQPLRFLERLLHAGLCACGDLYTHRDSIAALLVPWFAWRTVADQAAAFAGTSVSWALLRNLTGRPGSRY